MSKDRDVSQKVPELAAGKELTRTQEDKEGICCYEKGGAIWKKKSSPHGDSYIGFVPLYPRLGRCASKNEFEQVDEEGGVLSECVVC